MKKLFLYLFAFVMFFFTTFRAFSLEESHHLKFNKIQNFLPSNIEYSKKTNCSIKIDLIEDFENEDVKCLAKKNTISLFTNTLKNYSLTLFFKNKKSNLKTYNSEHISRIPRFSFLSLQVIQI